MGIDTFPPWTTKVRKDPLGSQSYNRLLNRFDWTEQLFSKEHLLQAGASVGVAGEHNAAEIPREVGSVYITAGPTGNVEGFRYATGATRTGLGAIHLALNAACYQSVDQMALQVTNSSETSLLKPCITTAILSTTGEIDFSSQYLTSALGAGNAWAAEDAHFCVAVHGTPLPVGTRAVKGTSKTVGSWLTDNSADYNEQVQVDADLHAKFLLEHNATGNHISREVARAYASVSVKPGGSDFSIVETGTKNPCTAATWISTGICELDFTTAWSLSAQPFFMADYQRNNGGASTDTYVICCPRSKIGTTKVTAYTYKFDFAAKTWARADTDFFAVVHGGA